MKRWLFSKIGMLTQPRGHSKAEERAMQLAERLRRYERLEEYRGRPLIVYATSTRPGLNAWMASDAVREFVDQIDAIA